jgi:hypothetical protein
MPSQHEGIAPKREFQQVARVVCENLFTYCAWVNLERIHKVDVSSICLEYRTHEKALC